MRKSSRPKITSKRDAYTTFISYFFAPYLFAGLGIYFVIWWRDRGALSYDHAKKTILLVILLSVGVLIYSWCKAFRAFFAIHGTDFDSLPDIPENVICLNCRELFLGRNVREMKCPKCVGTLEDLRGFYERHPELK